jgi:uncharacterized protein DUF5615
VNLFADESVDSPVVDRLRQDSHDVVYVAELAPGITDDAGLRETNNGDAVLATADKDANLTANWLRSWPSGRSFWTASSWE